EDFDPGNGKLRISTITGAVGKEVLTLGTNIVNVQSPWDASGVAPQLGSTTAIDNNDSRMQNCVYRGGSLWCTHTVFLPAQASDHSAVQWFQLTTAGSIQQFGRIEDRSAKLFFAFPTLAVNQNNDML